MGKPLDFALKNALGRHLVDVSKSFKRKTPESIAAQWIPASLWLTFGRHSRKYGMSLDRKKAENMPEDKTYMFHFGTD